MSTPFPRLVYRGNFALSRKADYGESILSAQYAGGFREDILVGSQYPLNSWGLTYSALLNTSYVEVPGSVPEPRDRYIWNFILRSKGGGNLPFVMTCPMDKKDYLCIFPENEFTFEIMDFRLRTTGLSIAQVFVRGVTVQTDGSLGRSI